MYVVFTYVYNVHVLTHIKCTPNTHKYKIVQNGMFIDITHNLYINGPLKL